MHHGQPNPNLRWCNQDTWPALPSNAAQEETGGKLAQIWEGLCRAAWPGNGVWMQCAPPLPPTPDPILPMPQKSPSCFQHALPPLYPSLCTTWQDLTCAGQHWDRMWRLQAIASYWAIAAAREQLHTCLTACLQRSEPTQRWQHRLSRELGLHCKTDVAGSQGFFLFCFFAA